MAAKMNKDILERAVSVVDIDPNNLEEECIRLPHLLLQYSFLSADVKRDSDHAEAQIKVVMSEQTTKIRMSPEEYGMAKATETGIASAVLQTKPYLEAQEKARELRHQWDLAQAVVWSLEAKKKSLQCIIDLRAQGYHGTPAPKRTVGVPKGR